MALISVKDACIGYGGHLLLDHIQLHIERHERVCLLGRNGSGKTTLLKLLHGDIAPDSGRVSRSQGITTARLDQEIPAGTAGSVFDIVTSGLAAKGRLLADYHRTGALLAEKGGDERRLLARLERLGHQLDAEQGWEIHRRVDTVIARMTLPADAEFTTLSTGLKRRTLLAQALVSGPDILLLDEPTNHLDIETLELLEEVLLEFEGTLLLVSHDRAFLNNVVTSTLVFAGGGKIEEYVGGYDDWLRQRDAPESAPGKPPSKKPPPRSRPPEIKMSYKEERELEALPARIHELEAEKERVCQALADPGLYRTAHRHVAAFNARLQSLEAELAAAYERWESLEERKAQADQNR